MGSTFSSDDSSSQPPIPESDLCRTVQPGDSVRADSFADDDGELTHLHPNYRTVLLIGTILAMVPLMIAAIVAETVIAAEALMPTGIIAGVVLLFALIIIFRFPRRRYGAHGYNLGEDRLRVVRGIWWHSDTIVPFGRVQHIDVDQGPIERAFGIATMTLHTAGNHNASVKLPGLEQGLAKEMREQIRAHIKRESL